MRHGASLGTFASLGNFASLGTFTSVAANPYSTYKNKQNIKVSKRSACESFASELRIHFFNAQSVCNKLPEFQVLLMSGEADIICVAETWLTDAYPDSILSLAGAFQILRSDRGSRGGGVLMCIRKGIAFAAPKVADNLELIAADLIARGSKYRLVVAYFPPRLDVISLHNYCAEIARLIDIPYPAIIVGDFNCAEIDWQLVSSPRGAVSQAFLEFTLTSGLEQLVLEPTRQNSILDLVLATNTETVNAVQVVEPFSNSDHNAIKLSIAWEPPKTESETYRDFRAANWTEIRAYLGSLDWAHIFGCCFTVQDCWDVLYGHLLYAVDSFVPSRVYSSTTEPLPVFMRKLRSRRRHLFRQRKCSAAASAKYYSYCTFYRRKLRAFLRRQEKRVLSGTSRNALYKFIRKKTKTKTAIPALESELKSDSDAFQTDFDKAQIINRFFASVYRQDKRSAAPVTKRVFHSELTTVSISEFTVKKILAKLPGKMSCGPDGIPSFLYKQCRNVLAFPLAALFQRSLDTGEVPAIWKRSLIVPIFKKGNRSKPTNYRPVSLLCCASLIFERCIKQAVVKHIEENHLLSEEQYGFRRGRSVEGQLLSTLNEWTLALDKGFCIDVLYTDFQKAFDTVSHSGLLLKLQALGIGGKLLTWIRNYFSERKQSVKIGTKLSDWIDITSGVPQGSVLGPLFFILFIDDLVKELPKGVKIKLYADDAKIYIIYPPSEWSPVLQSALSVLETWTTAWDLSLAVPKCLLLFLGRLNAKHSYRLFGHELQAVPAVRDLGVIVSEDLSWFPHISTIVAKASKCVNAIFKAFVYSDFELLARAYCTYVRPMLESASAVWSPYLKQDINLVESVQRKFSKRLFARCKLQSASYENRLAILKWPTLEERRKRADLMSTFKIIKGFSTGAVGLFSSRENRLNLRGNEIRLVAEHARLDIRKYFFAHRMVTIWNELQVDHSKIRTVNSFARFLSSL